MNTKELTRHVARELHINESQFRPYVDQLKAAGMLKGDDISKTATLLLAAATGDGAGGLIQRLQERAEMHVAQGDVTYWEGQSQTKEPATEILREELAVCDELDFLNAPLSKAMERCLYSNVIRDPGAPLISLTISRDRDLALLEAALPRGASGMLLYRSIPKSVFEGQENTHTPEYLDGLECTATINGESLKALAAIIRSQTTPKAEAA